MPSWRALLLAFLLPAVVLPDGMTVCLMRFFGQRQSPGCCVTCCARSQPPAKTPQFGAPRCAHCCLDLPAAARALDDAKAPVASAPSVVLALPTEFVAPSTLAFTPTCCARDHSPPHPPPLVAGSLPLRL